MGSRLGEREMMRFGCEKTYGVVGTSHDGGCQAEEKE